MHTTTTADRPLDEDADAPALLPCAVGLIAGTLALMTCWASPAPGTDGQDEAQMRALMARKIASNLYFLRAHPDLVPGLRQVISKVHQRWVLLAQSQPAAAEVGAPVAAALH